MTAMVLAMGTSLVWTVFGSGCSRGARSALGGRAVGHSFRRGRVGVHLVGAATVVVGPAGRQPGGRGGGADRGGRALGPGLGEQPVVVGCRREHDGGEAQ